VKDFVFFFAGRADGTNTACQQQSCPDGYENSGTVRLKLEEPTCEGVKMYRMHLAAPTVYETRTKGVGFPGCKKYNANDPLLGIGSSQFPKASLGQSLAPAEEI
jgi:hypothetical protein